jgi:hypothetical protein
VNDPRISANSENFYQYNHPGEKINYVNYGTSPASRAHPLNVCFGYPLAARRSACNDYLAAFVLAAPWLRGGVPATTA